MAIGLLIDPREQRLAIDRVDAGRRAASRLMMQRGRHFSFS
jgi:hypothetical protein